MKRVFAAVLATACVVASTPGFARGAGEEAGGRFGGGFGAGGFEHGHYGRRGLAVPFGYYDDYGDYGDYGSYSNNGCRSLDSYGCEQ
jgi:hypothetical protein